MKKIEAIQQLREMKNRCTRLKLSSHAYEKYKTQEEALDLAIAALASANLYREAWEPCEACKKRDCDNCLYSEYLSSFEPCKSCESESKWEPMQKFCGECGRPLTEDAGRAITELLVENQALHNAANGFKDRAEKAEKDAEAAEAALEKEGQDG